MVERLSLDGDSRWHCTKCRRYTEECICPEGMDQFRGDLGHLQKVIKHALDRQQELRGSSPRTRATGSVRLGDVNRPKPKPSPTFVARCTFAMLKAPSPTEWLRDAELESAVSALVRPRELVSTEVDTRVSQMRGE